LSSVTEKLKEAIRIGSEKDAREMAEKFVEQGGDPLAAISEVTVLMQEIGDKFSRFEIFLPEVILAADAVKEALAVLTAKIPEEKKREIRRGKVVIGTVFGDIHDIGKNLVATMLQVAGFEVVDLGADVPSGRFVDEAEKVKADIIAMSSLITPSMIYQKDVIDQLQDMGVRSRYRIMVGGAPVTPQWAERISADGWGKYAEDAVEVAKILMEGSREVSGLVARGAPGE
jgi:trimethylamine corrinoid protein